MANYPTSVPSFTTKSAGQTIAAAHLNSAQDEIVAIGTDLLKAWSSITPTWTNLSVGNATTNSCKYFQIGKFVLFRVDLVWGNTTSASGQFRVNFPVPAATGSSFNVAHGEAIDASTGDTFSLSCILQSGTVFAIRTDNGTKLVDTSATVPFTWTTSDEMHLLGFYEAA